MPEQKILVIDDEKLLRWSLKQNLEKEGYMVVDADKGMSGLSAYREESPDLTLLDINLPDISGVSVLEGIKEVNPDALVVMITAFGDIKTAVKTIKMGAYDFLEKPFSMDKLKILIQKSFETMKLRREVSQFREQITSRYGFDTLVGESPEMLNTVEMLKKIALSDATTVLITGESGTGKDVTAKMIHYQGQRADQPFMEINCTALPDTLIESELFGHEKGAFTDAKTAKKGLFELADGGSIFLDEIGDMQLTTQAKLLKVIESKTFKRVGGSKDITVNVRVITATNKNLDEEVRQGSFREDLYYRLKIIPVTLPPLRGRGRDIIVLANHFIGQFNKEFRKNTKGLTPETEAVFMQYNWPGNVRELKNVIERTMILESVEYIDVDHLPVELSSRQGQSAAALSSTGEGGPVDYAVRIPPDGCDIEEVEKELIRQAMEMTDGNQTRAARLLSLSRDAFRYRMQKFGFLQAGTGDK